MDHDKKLLLEKLIIQASKNVEGMSEATERTRQAAIDAPGRMQTRYGSEKEEYGYLADGLNLRKKQMEIDLKKLKSLHVGRYDWVTEGSLVRVQADMVNEDYFILPTNGGEVIQTDQGDITVMTPSAPLCSKMMGKGIGEDFYFELNGKKKYYRILKII